MQDGIQMGRCGRPEAGGRQMQGRWEKCFVVDLSQERRCYIRCPLQMPAFFVYALWMGWGQLEEREFVGCDHRAAQSREGVQFAPCSGSSQQTIPGQDQVVQRAGLLSGG